MSGYVGSGAHKISDIILFNLAIDVQEQSRAVLALAAGDNPRAGYVNARAALESAIDANYLVADPSEYDRRGARARVFELFASERLQQRAGISATSIPGSSEAVEQAVKADAALWEADAPGAKKTLLGEYERFARKPPSIGDHWSGLTRHEIYASLGGSPDEKEEMRVMLDSIYGMLSQHAHPGPRTSQREATLDAHNTIVFSGKAEDETHTREAAALAVGFMLAALQRRKSF